MVEINPATKIASLSFRTDHGAKEPERASSYSTKNASYGISAITGATES
ncbi:hypothetical protein [Dorea amylophila]|nr:hypothetical protein [Dorea amylophila]